MTRCNCVGCKRPVKAGGMCAMHYTRLRRGVSLSKPARPRWDKAPCHVEGCKRPITCNGMCQFHDQRIRLGIPLNAPVQERDLIHTPYFCNVPGCYRQRLAKGLCSLHRQRAKAGIPLYLPAHFDQMYANGWTTQRCPYKKVSRRSKEYFEHRLIAERMLDRELLPGEVVHHIDGDKTNNDPANLQVMTRSEHIALHNRLRGKRAA